MPVIFENQFFYNGVLRLNFGWASPNQAGAFIAALIALLWGMRGLAKLRFLGLILEGPLYLMLAKTSSRGAVASLLVVGGLMVASLPKDGRKLAVAWVVRLALLLCAIYGTTMEGRMRPAFVYNDQSISNRAQLNGRGLMMLAAAPFGWGFDRAGEAYENFFQGQEEAERYRGLVNGYLNIAVELGIIPATLSVAAAIWVGLWLVKLHKAMDIVGAGAGASLLTWLISNMFTTLWVVPAQLWMATALFIVLIVRAVSSDNGPRRILIQAGYGLVISTAISAGGLIVGRTRMQTSGVFITRNADGEVTLARARPAQGGSVWTFWTSKDVLGPTPGKEIRRLFAKASPDVYRIDIFQPASISNKTTPAKSDRYIFAGESVFRYFENPVYAGDVWIIHPTILPKPGDVGSKTNVRLVLPEVDELGIRDTWEHWARLTGARILQSTGCGSDIRPALLHMLDVE